jgi:outer membrane protein OmpA-like peptidoglycan-associated protein
VASDRMKTFGFGYSRPAADNSTGEGRSKNRRVELKVKK